MNQLTVTGEVNSKGQYGLYNIGQLNDFCSKHPKSKLIVTFRINEQGTVDSMIRYYRFKILPEWKIALFEIGKAISEEEIDYSLRKRCEITFRNGKLRSLKDLSKEEMIVFLDMIKFVSLEHVYLFVEDPRLL